MRKVAVERSLLVGAPPGKVFAVLMDPAHHKRILPEAFIHYEADAMDNSLVSFSLKVAGAVRNFKVQVEAIEDNSLIQERDLATGICTKFSLQEHPDGTIVTISTSYETQPGLGGIIESFTAPIFLGQLYEEELVKLGRYVLTLPAP